LTQAEEDEESALLMGMLEEIKDTTASPLAIKSAPVKQQQVHLDETKAQAFLSTSSSIDDRLKG
jgi:hypothetical protein